LILCGEHDQLCPVKRHTFMAELIPYAELVGLEIRQGLVTPEGAKTYGVVADADGVVDASATAALRESIKSDRGELPLFDYGPGIEHLRANCEEETGLPAPIQPVWHTENIKEAAA
jgi:N-methylhydantoinase B